jgi:hypothetical protein
MPTAFCNLYLYVCLYLQVMGVVSRVELSGLAGGTGITSLACQWPFRPFGRVAQRPCSQVVHSGPQLVSWYTVLSVHGCPLCQKGSPRQAYVCCALGWWRCTLRVIQFNVGCAMVCIS